MDFRLNNGKPKVTVIQRFDHLVILLGPETSKKRKFNNLEDMKHFIQRKGYEVNVSHLHPGQNKKTKS